MRSQGSQQWRPKLKVQCGTASTSELVPAAMAENSESTKPESRVSSSMEVTKLVIESMKRNRGKLKRKIEAATNTSLSISKQKTGCFVVVEGATDDAVKQATKRLQDLLQKTVDGKVSVEGDRTVTESVQWVPKAVRGLHTSSADNIKAADTANVDVNGEETIAGSIHVDKKLLRLVKGHKNEVKERIEKSTSTSIQIGSPVVVKGGSEESVQKALEEIQKVIDEGVADSKFQYSHFISVPLCMHAPLVKQLEDFQQSVLVMLGVPPTEEATVQVTIKAAEADAGKAATSKLGFGTEAAELEVEVDSKKDGDEITETEAQIEEAANEILEQSVLSSLGIDPKEPKRQVLADSVFKDVVLSSLRIPAENEQEEEETGLQTTCTGPGQVKSTVEVSEGANLEVAMEVYKDGTTDNEAGGTAGDDDVEEVNDSDTIEHTDADARTVEKADLETGAEETKEVKETEEYEPLKEVAFARKKTSASGVEPSIFIKPTRFHLTLLMLKLWNEDRVEKAREVFRNTLPKAITALGGRPVSVSLTGLEIMKGSPKNTRVLYAKVSETDGEDRLSRACQVIIDEFVESGLVLGKDRDQVLKLHATVMNTSHRRSKSKYKNKGFDATEILAKFGEENWGDQQILEVHLSERFKYDENDYYHCCGSIPFPGNETMTTEKPEAVS